jgi:broad specificity phosphatase PhoE
VANLNSIDAAMPAVIVLGRHGHSEGQAAAELEKQGDLSAFTPNFRRTPSSQWHLTREGVRQAQSAGAWLQQHMLGSRVLASESFDRGYFSPHVRSRQTMGAILYNRENIVEQSHFGLPRIRWDIRLREQDFGDVSTIPRSEFELHYPVSVRNRQTDPLYARLPGGESIPDVMDRTWSFLGALARAHARGVDSALIVSHGRQITATQLALEGIDPHNWEEFEKANRIDNCQMVAYSRRDPKSGKEHSGFHWVSSTSPWQTPEQPPTWREFAAPTAVAVEECLRGIPEEWLSGESVKPQ